MKTEERTLRNLRNSMDGKIFVFLKDEKTRAEFAADAAREGYGFGTAKPTAEIAENVIALCSGKQLSHVGAVGRIEFQCNGGDNRKGRFHRIDYAKYKRGDKNFYVVFGG